MPCLAKTYEARAHQSSGVVCLASLIIYLALIPLLSLITLHLSPIYAQMPIYEVTQVCHSP